LLFVNTSPYPNDRAVQLIFLSASCLYGRPTFFITRTLSARVWCNQTVINFACAIEITWHHMQLMVNGLYYSTNFTFCTYKLISMITLIYIPDYAVTWKKFTDYRESVSCRHSVCIMDHAFNRPLWPNPNGKVSWLIQLNCESLPDAYHKMEKDMHCQLHISMKYKQLKLMIRILISVI